jgi:hypothetical protein
MPPDNVIEHLGDVIGIAGLAEQAAAEGHGPPNGLEGVGRQLLRHEADHRAGGAVVPDDVVAVDRHGAGTGIDDAADDADQRRLAGAVRAEQAENLALADLQVDIFKRLKTRGVGLGKIGNGNDGLHEQ